MAKTEVGLDLPCTVCHGSKNEHEGSIHEYTVLTGDLRPQKDRVPPDDEKRRRMLENSEAGNHPTSLGRLITVLARKGILDDDDVLKIVGFLPMDPEGA